MGIYGQIDRKKSARRTHKKENRHMEELQTVHHLFGS
jgi:hypothetical protein